MTRLVVATSFPVHPPRGGGQERIRGLYGAVAAAGVPVDIVAMTAHEERAQTLDLAPGLREIRVPQSLRHHDAEIELAAGLRVPVTDLVLGTAHERTPAYGEALRAACEGAAAVVASHPFGYPAIRAAVPNMPLIYEAHNVELDLKQSLLSSAGGDADRAAQALELVRAWEAGCCTDAALVVTCSHEDRARLGELYGLGEGRAVVVPNGCSCDEITFTDAAQREVNRAALGIEGFLALFVGSWHGPNLEAAHLVLQAARERPDMQFLLLGSAGLALGRDLPRNVDAPGPVHERFLNDAFRVAHVALNPMRSGSGTNLKMLQYAAAGVPMVASEFGARGLGMDMGRHYLACDDSNLGAVLQELREESTAGTSARVQRALERVQTSFDWPVIAAAWMHESAMKRILHH